MHKLSQSSILKLIVPKKKHPRKKHHKKPGRSHLFFAIALLMLALSISALLFVQQNIGWRIKQPPIQPTNVVQEKTKQILKAMTLEEKIGQMMIIGFEHVYVDEHITKMIEKYGISGINLIRKNVQNEAQVKDLIIKLQKMSRIPLFIAADQEGGSMNRFSFLKELTAQSDLASQSQAWEVAKRRGEELKTLGVNMIFSPVVDYVEQKDSYLFNRTFKKTPEETARLAEAMVRGYEAGGVMPVVKHLPGYGNVTKDPHAREVARNEKRNEGMNLVIEKVLGSKLVAAIMTAHIKLPSTNGAPATLSENFVTDKLRNEYGFRGLIISDDIEMASAGKDPAESAVKAVEAGVDVIISTLEPETQLQIIKRLTEEVRSGRLKEGRINEAVFRILISKINPGETH